MKRCLLALLRVSVLGAVPVVCGLGLFFETASSAEDGPSDAGSMLDNLRRRSAEERWQRIKRDSAVTRQQSTPKNSEIQGKPGTDDTVPPSPEGGPLIPRLSALPVDTSNDWVLPARPLHVEDGAVVPPPDLYFSKETAAELKLARAANRLASQDAQPTPDPEQKMIEPDPKLAAPVSPRNVLARKIGDINPHYERDRDTDIREFAREKIKEYEGSFHPKAYVERSFPEIVFAWEPTNMYYFPLYFQDAPLERTGHSYHPVVQPFASIARFGVQFVMLPYQMTIDPISTRTYPLGWYRPGEWAPKLHYQPPLNAAAAAVEAGFISGVYFVIP